MNTVGSHILESVLNYILANQDLFDPHDHEVCDPLSEEQQATRKQNLAQGYNMLQDFKNMNFINVAFQVFSQSPRQHKLSVVRLKHG